jgi:hypothetical protein
MNLLNILSVITLHKLQKLPEIFDDYFQYACDVHSYSTRYASKKNFYKPKTRTNIGKQSVYSIAVDFWQELPCDFKILPNFSFNGKVKQFLLQNQNSK